MNILNARIIRGKNRRVILIQYDDDHWILQFRILRDRKSRKIGNVIVPLSGWAMAAVVKLYIEMLEV